MKKNNINKLVVWCLLLATTTLGYAQNKGKDYALLTVKSLNYADGDYFSLTEAVRGGGSTESLKMFDKNGMYIEKIRANDKIMYLFTASGYSGSPDIIPLYFKDNEDLQVTYIYKNVLGYPKVTYKGKYANVCRYLVKKANHSTKLNQSFLGGNNSPFTLNERDFVLEMKKVKKKSIALAKKARLSPEFLERELRHLEYAYYVRLSYYRAMHARTTGNPDFETSPSFPSFSNDPTIDKNNLEDFQADPKYRELLTLYYQQLLLDNTKYSLTLSGPKSYEKNYTLKMLRGIGKSKAHEYIKNELLYTLMNKDSLSRANNLDELYNEYMKWSTHEKHRKEITDIYHKLGKAKTAKGNYPPKFYNYKNHKGGKVSLDDLKGKYVYIDVWATWCRPCLMEVPHLEKMEKKYHDKNIAFVSISVDEAEAYGVWNNLVTKNNMGGIQLIADKAFESDFIRYFDIRSIPRFILIDPEGKVIDGSAPRPSDPSLDKLLSKLLN